MNDAGQRSLRIDPLLGPGKRFWLLLANLASAALLGYASFSRPGRLGVDRGRMLFWTGFILLGGLPVWLLHRVIETSRAHRSSPELLDAPEPLIRSA
ncbi:MAG: hypothetical protein ACE5F1_11605 [Planctomycetota bacterium]